MKPSPKKFRAVVQDGHKGCAVEVPFDPREVWGELPTEIVYQRVRGIRVQGKLDRASFESWIIHRWGKFFLLVNGDVLERASSAAGEVASISLSPKSSDAEESVR